MASAVARLPGRSWPAIRTALFALLLGSVGLISAWRGLQGKFDFHHFYLDAAYVWQHGALNPNFDSPVPQERRQLPFYLPVVPLALAPLAAGGLPPAAILWALLHVLCLAACLRLLTRQVAPAARPGNPPAPAFRGGAADIVLLACALSLPALYEAAKFNQLSFIVLALVLAGVAAVQRGRPLSAGLCLAAAAILKILPGIMLIWLVVRRKWSAAAAMLIWLPILAFLPPLLAFGPRAAVAYHLEWIDYNVRGAPAQGLIDDSLDDHFVDRRNQSIEVVLARWFVPEHRFHLPVTALHLSEPECTAIARAIKLLLAGGLLFIAWRSATASEAPLGFWALAGAFMLGMLVFSPLLRQYYLVWALPTIVLFTGAACGYTRDPSAPRPAWAPAARWGLVVWLVGMVAWLFEPARTAGAHLLMLLLMGAALLRMQALAARGRDSGLPLPAPGALRGAAL